MNPALIAGLVGMFTNIIGGAMSGPDKKKDADDRASKAGSPAQFIAPQVAQAAASAPQSTGYGSVPLQTQQRALEAMRTSRPKARREGYDVPTYNPYGR